MYSCVVRNTPVIDRDMDSLPAYHCPGQAHALYTGLRLFEHHCFQTLTAVLSTLFVGVHELVSRYACLSEYRPQS